eukprot:CAMPEP_0184741046 /NCGR_PEP_ID=MMETSP0315-20130426/4131_1 /TAXON_ID=101924 /ORGANISM="Rhodosorus marinus, Strain UTEX LB 2760" /LENGTH=86 /DNA_ID=CAMNT_0027211161 /DNA_START=303 /DNA_END=560 /DNA_ORIENTATION=+
MSKFGFSLGAARPGDQQSKQTAVLKRGSALAASSAAVAPIECPAATEFSMSKVVSGNAFSNALSALLISSTRVASCESRSASAPGW